MSCLLVSDYVWHRPTFAAAAVLSCGGLQLDLRTRRALVGGRAVDLSAREFALAETFLRHAGQVLSREQLLSQVWGYDFDPARTSWTCTCGICAESSAQTASSRFAAWATGWTPCLSAGRVRRARRRTRRRSAWPKQSKPRSSKKISNQAVVVETEIVVTVVRHRGPRSRHHQSGDRRRHEQHLPHGMASHGHSHRS